MIGSNFFYNRFTGPLINYKKIAAFVPGEQTKLVNGFVVIGLVAQDQ